VKSFEVKLRDHVKLGGDAPPGLRKLVKGARAQVKLDPTHVWRGEGLEINFELKVSFEGNEAWKELEELAKVGR
jgi:hypothetical protein